jgi:hypothetical protein
MKNNKDEYVRPTSRSFLFVLYQPSTNQSSRGFPLEVTCLLHMIAAFRAVRLSSVWAFRPRQEHRIVGMCGEERELVTSRASVRTLDVSIWC